MNSSRAFEYFGSFICDSMSLHTFSHLGRNSSFCSIGNDAGCGIYKLFAKMNLLRHRGHKGGIH